MKYHARRRKHHMAEELEGSPPGWEEFMTSRCRVLLFLVVVVAVVACVPAGAQNPYLGEIRYVAFNFAPKGWMTCSGQLLAISENQALFQLLGTTFGGDGKSTFGLPDMRGRVPVGTGQGLGLTNRTLGEQGGQESVALTVAQMPAHRHTLNASNAAASSNGPAGNVLAATSSTAIYTNQAPDVTLEAASVNIRGQSQPHENMQPYLGMTCVIAVQGIFPSPN
jgi:microcystin-dependent protein